MSAFLQILLTGFAVLIVAIFINALANLLGVETWYGFIEEIQKNGISNTLKTKWAHLIFLLFIYPFLLGLTAYYCLKIFS